MRRINMVIIAALLLAGSLVLVSCSGSAGQGGGESAETARYLNIIDSEPDTMDPQCTSGYYTVPLNIFDRLVEIKTAGEEPEIAPSLAESWEISDDGLRYTFHLHEGVKFSNGEELTSEDVEYSFNRLLTHEDSCNQDLIMSVLGAESLRSGKTGQLRGFTIIDEHSFTVELDHPYSAFLACLATPGASILDKQSTERAGSAFGTDIERTVGSGPFKLDSWESGERIIMSANSDCWSGAPGCDGVNMIFDSGEISHIDKFNDGEIDILDLDRLDSDAEYFARGDIYLKHIVRSTRVGISYIALNESVEPLGDPKVRKALQIAIDRRLLLKAVLSDRGRIENGIFPYGLTGHNPKLAEIPYDPAKAAQLLGEAGYGEGFELELDCESPATESQKDLLDLIAYMWGEIGIKTNIRMIESDEYYELRNAGKLACYTSTWSADYDDPNNFINTFFGSEENTKGRSLCYGNKEVMDRVGRATEIVDEKERIKEYQELERIIVQDDAAWIPLYSKQHLFVISDRVSGFNVLWNGWSSNAYRDVSIEE